VLPAKPKSSKGCGGKEGKGMGKRTVSFPTMFSTIVEKVEEEEKAGKEAERASPSPLTHFYDSLTLKGRTNVPSFLGDWAFVDNSHKSRGGGLESMFKILWGWRLFFMMVVLSILLF
jgi:hypothetical protein